MIIQESLIELLKDLNTLRNVKLVMARGRLYDKPIVKRKKIVDEQLDKYLEI